MCVCVCVCVWVGVGVCVGVSVPVSVSACLKRTLAHASAIDCQSSAWACVLGEGAQAVRAAENKRGCTVCVPHGCVTPVEQTLKLMRDHVWPGEEARSSLCSSILALVWHAQIHLRAWRGGGVKQCLCVRKKRARGR